jgi:hypothetical protein
MKTILVSIFIAICYFSCPCQDIISNGHYQSPYFVSLNSNYIFNGDTFYTYIPFAHMKYTVKGTYEIIGDKIFFYPIAPEKFRKSVVTYEKSNFYRNFFNNFWFTVHCKNPNHKNFLYKVRFSFKNSLNGSSLSVQSNGDSLNVFFSGRTSIDQISIGTSSFEKTHEDILLEFDDKCFGHHYYNITLAEDSNTYFSPVSYSFNIFNRTSSGFFLCNSKDTVEYRKTELCTDEFLLNKREKRLNENYYYNYDLQDQWLMIDQLIKSW